MVRADRKKGILQEERRIRDSVCVRNLARILRTYPFATNPRDRVHQGTQHNTGHATDVNDYEISIGFCCRNVDGAVFVK